MASSNMLKDPAALHAWNAVVEFVARSLVFIVPGHSNQLAREIGSGTALRTPGGRVVVLTANHVVEDWPKRHYAVGRALSAGGVDEAFSHVYAPVGRDVAIAVLTDRASLFCDDALPTSVVATDAHQGEEFSFVVGGFPWDLVRTIWEPTLLFQIQAFATMMFGCAIDGVDEDGRYKISWDQATPIGTKEGLASVGMIPGVEQPLPRPGGISGGALWRFNGRVPRGALWSPRTAGQIVGIPVSWIPDDRLQFIEASATWARWFAETIKCVDGA